MSRLCFGLCLTLMLAGHAPAAIVFDSGGFEAYAPGILVGQNGGGTIPWADIIPPTGNRFAVQSAVTNGGMRAVSATSTNAISAFVAPLVNFTPTAGELVVIEVDIARTVSGSAALPSSNGFNIDVYDSAGNRTLGFGLGVNAANTTIIPFVTRFQSGNPNGASDAINLNVQQNQFVRFRAELNYVSDTFQLFANDINVAGTFQFVNAAAALGDADLQHDPVVGAADFGYFDNYRITTIAVPEPCSAVSCSFVLAGLLWRRRQRRASASCG